MPPPRTYLYRRLRRKNAKYVWEAKTEKSFRAVKREIVRERSLTPYDPSLPVTSTCDASPAEIARILALTTKGVEKPIVISIIAKLLYPKSILYLYNTICTNICEL